jgi:hypothetical protein
MVHCSINKRQFTLHSTIFYSSPFSCVKNRITRQQFFFSSPKCTKKKLFQLGTTSLFSQSHYPFHHFLFDLFLMHKNSKHPTTIFFFWPKCFEKNNFNQERRNHFPKITLHFTIFYPSPCLCMKKPITRRRLYVYTSYSMPIMFADFSLEWMVR